MKRVLAQKRTVKLPLAEVLGKHWKIVLLGAGVLPIIHVTYFKAPSPSPGRPRPSATARAPSSSIIVVALVVRFLNQPLGALLTSRIDMRKAACLMVLPEFILMPAMFFAVETRSTGSPRSACAWPRCRAMFWRGGRYPRPSLPGAGALHRPVAGLPALLAAGRRRYFSTGQWILNSTGSIVGVAWPRPATRWSRWPVPGPVADHRVPRQRPVDRRARRRRGLTAARNGRAGTGVARPARLLGGDPG